MQQNIKPGVYSVKKPKKISSAKAKSSTYALHLNNFSEVEDVGNCNFDAGEKEQVMSCFPAWSQKNSYY